MRVFRVFALTRAREVFTAAALLLVVGTALIMDGVGLSMAMGAFLAGVLLAIPSTAISWKPTSSRSVDFSWASSSSPSACRSTGRSCSTTS
jgi:hypothetical protein